MIGAQAWVASRARPALMPRRFREVSGVACLNKPRGDEDGHQIGLWTSTWLGDEAISDWVRWCVDEDFGLPDSRRLHVWLLDVCPDIGIYEIDGVADLDALVARYGVPSPYPFQVGDGMFPYIDADRLTAEGVTGIHLTDRGRWATRHRYDAPPGAPSLAGWDCESTLWLRWPGGTVRYLGPRVVPEREPYEWEETNPCAGLGDSMRRSSGEPPE